MDDTAFVKFYGENDLSSPYYLELIEDKLSNDFVTADNKIINHIIELYNIKKYIDGGLYLKRWDNHRIIMYKEICGKDIPAAIGRFMSQINDDNINEEYSEVSINYTDDFWALFDKFKLYERISDAIFSELIRSKSTFLSEVLCFSRIVNSYGEDIRQFLIDDSKNAELLLQEYLSERDPGRKLFFPKEMSAEDKISLSWSYIMSSNPNLNYVRLIYKSNSTPDLPIDDKLKLEAKRVAEKLENELFSSDSGISYSITLVFSNVEEEMRLERNGLDTALTYSKKWIHCNLDYPTILNNFIYLFQYVDKYCRCTFVSLPNDLGIFERIAGVRGKQEYLIGSSFTYVGKLTNMQMNAYRKCLEEKNISLEEVYKWFFEEYLDSEFGAKGFTYDIPSKGASYLEKCRALLISLDSVLKQYKLYCEYSNIDRELFELSSGHIVFDTIQSMTQDRYIYIIAQIKLAVRCFYPILISH